MVLLHGRKYLCKQSSCQLIFTSQFWCSESVQKVKNATKCATEAVTEHEHSEFSHQLYLPRLKTTCVYGHVHHIHEVLLNFPNCDRWSIRHAIKTSPPYSWCRAWWPAGCYKGGYPSNSTWTGEWVHLDLATNWCLVLSCFTNVFYRRLAFVLKAKVNEICIICDMKYKLSYGEKNVILKGFNFSSPVFFILLHRVGISWWTSIEEILWGSSQILSTLLTMIH